MNQGTPLTVADIERLDFTQGDGLLPAIVQHAGSGAVLMLGYMNRAALRATFERRRVVFFSRSRQRLWEKGEDSSHAFDLLEIRADCDADALLVTARPRGPACHLGSATCFGDEPATPSESLAFLMQLEKIVQQRIDERSTASYTARLVSQGAARVAQKVGEEGVELALALASEADEKVIEEAADLIFHLVVALQSRHLRLPSVIERLRARHSAQAGYPA